MYEGIITEIKEGLLPTIQNTFPQNVVRNDMNIDWMYGGIYTFEPLGGEIRYRGVAIVIYQILTVNAVSEDGDRQKVGETTYTSFIDGNDPVYDVIENYMESPDLRKEVLAQALREALEEHIESFEDGYLVEGCRFIANDSNLLLTKEAVLQAFQQELVERMKNFPVELLMTRNFEKGIYRLKVENIHVFVDASKNGEYTTNLELACQNYKTLHKEMIRIQIASGIQMPTNNPPLRDLQNIAEKVIGVYKEKYPVIKEFGMEFHFTKELPERQDDTYRKIQGTDEELEIWVERMYNVLEQYEEQLGRGLKKLEAVNQVGYRLVLKNDAELVFGSNGIMLNDESYVYLKQEMNLQEGLQRLARILGKNRITLELMRVYDYRKKVASRGDA